jgi:hypothetical protein
MRTTHAKEVERIAKLMHGEYIAFIVNNKDRADVATRARTIPYAVMDEWQRDAYRHVAAVVIADRERRK